MPETVEDWARLVISIVFIGFACLVIGFIFHSLIVWLCLGLLVGIMILYPVVKNRLAMVSAQRGHQVQGYEIGQKESLMSKSKRLQQLMPTSKQQQLPAPKSQQQLLMPEIKKPSTQDPDVQHYVPPGLPPDFFL